MALCSGNSPEKPGFFHTFSALPGRPPPLSRGCAAIATVFGTLTFKLLVGLSPEASTPGSPSFPRRD
jgi:hypothetical protein